MIDVEQRALRTLEQHRLAGAHVTVEQRRDVGHHRPQALGQLQVFIQHLLIINRVGLKIILQREVVVLHDFSKACSEALGIQEVGHAQATARHLVLIGRTDAAAGGANGRLAALFLARHVERHVITQDERTGIAHAQAFAHGHAARREMIDLLEQGRG